WPMKSKTRPGLKNSMAGPLELRSDAQALDLRPAHPPVEDEARAEEAREQAAQDADDEGEGEALHRARSVLREDEARDEHRHVPVDDRRPRPVVPLIHGLPDALPGAQFFSYALVDQHVDVDAHAERERQAGDAG